MLLDKNYRLITDDYNFILQKKLARAGSMRAVCRMYWTEGRGVVNNREHVFLSLDASHNQKAPEVLRGIFPLRGISPNLRRIDVVST